MPLGLTFWEKGRRKRKEVGKGGGRNRERSCVFSIHLCVCRLNIYVCIILNFFSFFFPDGPSNPSVTFSSVGTRKGESLVENKGEKRESERVQCRPNICHLSSLFSGSGGWGKPFLLSSLTCKQYLASIHWVPSSPYGGTQLLYCTFFYSGADPSTLAARRGRKGE